MCRRWMAVGSSDAGGVGRTEMGVRGGGSCEIYSSSTENCSSDSSCISYEVNAFVNKFLLITIHSYGVCKSFSKLITKKVYNVFRGKREKKE